MNNTLGYLPTSGKLSCHYMMCTYMWYYMSIIRVALQLHRYVRNQSQLRMDLHLYIYVSVTPIGTE